MKVLCLTILSVDPGLANNLVDILMLKILVNILFEWIFLKKKKKSYLNGLYDYVMSMFLSPS